MAIYNHNPGSLPSADADRWTPVLDGDIFCSPACGAKCKLADYEQAVKDAAMLAARLGEGWEPRVWENCHWYYEVVRGDVTVRRYDQGGYNATIKVDCIEDRHISSIRCENDDPRLAIKGLIEKLAMIVARLSRAKASILLEPMLISAREN